MQSLKINGSVFLNNLNLEITQRNILRLSFSRQLCWTANGVKNSTIGNGCCQEPSFPMLRNWLPAHITPRIFLFFFFAYGLCTTEGSNQRIRTKRNHQTNWWDVITESSLSKNSRRQWKKIPVVARRDII